MDSLHYKVLKSKRIVLRDQIVDGGIVVDKAGKIKSVLRTRNEYDAYVKKRGSDLEVVDLENLVILPGVVDSHVHVNEPGREDWEGFSSATAAAAAGGVTTIIDMPLNSIPPTTTVHNLKIKADAASGKIRVDVGFWGGVVPGNQGELIKLVKAGVVGFKCFLCPSGVDEFQHVREEDLVLALEQLDKTHSLLAFHAECEGESTSIQHKDPEQYASYLQTRPAQMEIDALKIIRKLASQFSTRLHIVHLSAAEGLEHLREMRKIRKESGAKTWKYGVTAETCYHYLTLDAESVPSKRSDYKCAPPVRSAVNKDKLWAALNNDEIDLVVSDHSPCTPNLKTNNFITAWGGISSLQFGISLFWTEARQRGFSLVDVAKFLSSGPAELCQLSESKGAIEETLDADFVVFDPNEAYTVTTDIIHHKNKLTPYLGKELVGRVVQTYLRGNIIYDKGDFVGIPAGRMLLSEDFKNVLLDDKK